MLTEETNTAIAVDDGMFSTRHPFSRRSRPPISRLGVAQMLTSGSQVADSRPRMPGWITHSSWSHHLWWCEPKRPCRLRENLCRSPCLNPCRVYLCLDPCPDPCRSVCRSVSRSGATKTGIKTATWGIDKDKDKDGDKDGRMRETLPSERPAPRGVPGAAVTGQSPRRDAGLAKWSAGTASTMGCRVTSRC